MLVLAWAALTGLLIAAGLLVIHSSSVDAFDRHVTSVVVAHRSPALNETMKAVTWLGSWVALVGTAVLLVALAFRRRLPPAAVVLAVVAWAGENGGVLVAKHVVGRERPPAGSPARLGARMVVAVGSHGRRRPGVHHLGASGYDHRPTVPAHRWLAWVLAALAVAAVAFSRVELGVHWTTDVLASMVFVGAWLRGSARIVRVRCSPEGR